MSKITNGRRFHLRNDMHARHCTGGPVGGFQGVGLGPLEGYFLDDTNYKKSGPFDVKSHNLKGPKINAKRKQFCMDFNSMMR